jgi:hypothetical protein
MFQTTTVVLPTETGRRSQKLVEQPVLRNIRKDEQVSLGDSEWSRNISKE